MSLIIAGIYIVCTLLSLATGRADQAGRAVMEGAEGAVGFAISVGGGICLWSAALELMEQSGISRALSAALGPALRRQFPRAAADADTLAALSENVSANLLGLGNAATPAGIRAARGMARLGGRRAGDELCLLVVLNTASIQLLPTTIASVRSALGAASPFDIMPAVWLSSAVSVAAGLGVAALLKRLWP